MCIRDRWEIVRSIPGLEQAEMLRPGYAIEYDSVDAKMCIRDSPGC